MNNKFLRIGQIVRPHGVWGAVKVIPAVDDIEYFRALPALYLEKDGVCKALTVRDVRIVPGAVLLRLAGTDSPEGAERLRGLHLCVERTQAAKLPPDTWYVADLIGCETSDTEGSAYGVLTDVLVTGANDVYEIEHGKLLVPALKKVLASVDTLQKRIVFHAAILQEVGLFAD